MTVQKLLKPYSKRFYGAYLLKIGLLAIIIMFGFSSILLAVSKWIMVFDLQKWILIGNLGIAIISIIIGWHYKPCQKNLHKVVDGLGFENRVTTYFDYIDRENPFVTYLENDLNYMLEEKPRYKEMKLKPQNHLLAVFGVLCCIIVGLLFVKTDISQKTQEISEKIDQIEEQQEGLLEKLKESDLLPEELANLEEVTEDYLESVKEGLRQENREFVEENMFKLETAVEEALAGESIPEILKTPLEGMKEVALSEEQSSLLATLGQSGMTMSELAQSEGVISQENMSQQEGNQEQGNQEESGNNQQSNGNNQQSNNQQDSSGNGT